MADNDTTDTTQGALENACERGHEFLKVPTRTKKETKGFTTFAVNVKCPGCEKAFPLLATRGKDGAAYLPRHTKPGTVTEKVPPAEPNDQAA